MLKILGKRRKFENVKAETSRLVTYHINKQNAVNRKQPIPIYCLDNKSILSIQVRTRIIKVINGELYLLSTKIDTAFKTKSA